jgi:hypothetical protein
LIIFFFTKTLAQFLSSCVHAPFRSNALPESLNIMQAQNSIRTVNFGIRALLFAKSQKPDGARRHSRDRRNVLRKSRAMDRPTLTATTQQVSRDGGASRCTI